MLAKLEPSNAERYLKELLKSSVPSARQEAALRLIEIYLSSGRREEARRLLDRYGEAIGDVQKLTELYAEAGDYKRAYELLSSLVAADARYAELAYRLGVRHSRPEFYLLAMRSPDARIASAAAYRLERYYFERGNLKEGLKAALALKVKNLRYEPTYSRAFLLAAQKLYEAGYKTDACNLLREVSTGSLTASERELYRRLSLSCGG